MQLLNFNCVMIYIIHQVLVLIKIHLNYLKDNSSTIHFFFKKNFFFFHNMVKEIKHELNNTLIKLGHI